MSDSETPDPLREALRGLQRKLAQIDPAPQPDGRVLLTERVILREGFTRLAVYSENSTHRLPHFHIHYKSEFSASYSIAGLELLAGNMPSKYEGPILEWARANPGLVAAEWRQLNPNEERVVSLPGEHVA